MAVYLIRHAHAGSRGPGHHDIYRPLSEKGARRATALVELLADVPFASILSSPATRCVQTVEPLAAARGMEIVESEDLWEDADVTDVLELIERAAAEGSVDSNVAVSSHGNLIPIIVEVLAARGVPIKGRGCEKGSVWLLEHDGASFTSARYTSKTAEMLLA